MDSGLAFAPYDGDLMGLCCNDNHWVFRWSGPGKVLFSVSRRGNAASCHFASNKPGLRHLKRAIDEFVRFVFDLFDWCTMVLAQVRRESVSRLIRKVGFQFVITAGDISVYMRTREWAE